MSGTKQLWHSSGYPAWFTSDTATAVGAVLRTLTISLIGYSVSGSTVAAGWLGSLSIIAQQGAGIFGGTYVDRHDRRTLIIVNAVVGFLSWGSVALLLMLGSLPFPLLLAIAVISSGINGFLGSAADAMLKSIIDIREYPKARSLNEGRDAAINMSGSPAGGFLYSVHPWFPFLTAALMYAVAGVAATRIPKQKKDELTNAEKTPDTSFHARFCRRLGVVPAQTPAGGDPHRRRTDQLRRQRHPIRHTATPSVERDERYLHRFH